MLVPWRMLPIKRQAARHESKSVNTWIFWAAACSTQYLSLQERACDSSLTWQLLGLCLTDWKIAKVFCRITFEEREGTGAIPSAHILLQNDSCLYPSRKSCVWEDNRFAQVRNKLLLYCLKKSQKCGRRSSSVICQGSVFICSSEQWGWRCSAGGSKHCACRQGGSAPPRGCSSRGRWSTAAAPQHIVSWQEHTSSKKNKFAQYFYESLSSARSGRDDLASSREAVVGSPFQVSLYLGSGTWVTSSLSWRAFSWAPHPVVCVSHCAAHILPQCPGQLLCMTWLHCKIELPLGQQFQHRHLGLCGITNNNKENSLAIHANHTL